MRTFLLVSWATAAEVASLCLVLHRAGYEVAVEMDETRVRLLVEHDSELALRALGPALEHMRTRLVEPGELAS